MGMSLRAYARHRAVALSAVQKAIATGRITLEPDGTIDVAQADAQWQASTRPMAQPQAEAGADTGPAASKAPNYQTSRAIREAYAARLAKLEFEERAGKLVNVDEVKATTFRLARQLRDRMQQIPRKVAPEIVAQVVANPDVEMVVEMLDEAIREALEELSRGSTDAHAAL